MELTRIQIWLINPKSCDVHRVFKLILNQVQHKYNLQAVNNPTNQDAKHPRRVQVKIEIEREYHQSITREVSDNSKIPSNSFNRHRKFQTSKWVPIEGKLERSQEINKTHWPKRTSKQKLVSL